MGVMNKMRDRLHVVVYALIFFFSALIVLEWGMNFSEFSGRRVDVGNVNRTPIDIEEYERIHRQYRQNYIRQSGGSGDLPAAIENQLSQTVWDNLILQKILKEEVEKQNIFITNQEIVDIIHSDTPPEVIQKNFSDPNTNLIDREKLRQAIENPQNKQAWIDLEASLKQNTIYNKLQEIIKASVQVSYAESALNQKLTKGMVAAKYYLLPLSKGKPDSVYTPSESEISAYYTTHKSKFKQVPTRSAKFVFFKTTPSNDDTLTITNELKKIKLEFQYTKNDSEYVSIYSDQPINFNEKLTLEKAGLVSASFDTMKVPKVVGPYIDNDHVNLFKILESSKVVKASHILIKADENASNSERKKALQKARRVLAKVKLQKDFSTLAKQYSEEEAAKSTGGDLGWFGKNAMVKEFQNAAFNGKKGEILGPIKTKFGYHIIKVTGTDSLETFGVKISKKIEPGSETLGKYSLTAEEFAIETESSSFDSVAKHRNLDIKQTGAFQINGFIPLIGSSQKVSGFAFTSAVGEVSDVIKVEDGYVVLELTEKKDDPYKAEKEVEDEIVKSIIEIKKTKDLTLTAENILKKASYKFEEIPKVDSSLVEKSFELTELNKNYISDLGSPSEALMASYLTDEGEIAPIASVSNGVCILLVTNKKIPSDEEIELDKTTFITDLLEETEESLSRTWSESLKRNASIEDNRAYYY